MVATKKPTVAGPLPELPDVTVIQLTLLAADQGQAAGADIATVPLNPPEAGAMFPRPTPYQHEVLA